MNQFSKELSSANKNELWRILYEFMKICDEIGLTEEDIRTQERQKALKVVKKGKKSMW